jgi:putative N6-adenine-specific DNA methylase
LMAYCRIPGNYRRERFGFQFLPDYDEPLWLAVKKETDRAMRKPSRGLISGSDIAEEAVALARKNITDLPYGDRVGLEVADFRTIPELRDRVILCNPPYGIWVRFTETWGTSLNKDAWVLRPLSTSETGSGSLTSG